MTELDLSDDLLKSLISARKDPGQKDHQPVGKSQPVGPVRDTKSLFWYETEQKNITMPKAEVVSWAVRRED